MTEEEKKQIIAKLEQRYFEQYGRKFQISTKEAQPDTLWGYGLELSTAFRQGYGYEDWFLAAPSDVRSSFQLEVAATEFECQGLELDWVGVCWGGYLTWDGQRWCHQRFRGKRWQPVKRPHVYTYTNPLFS